MVKHVKMMDGAKKGKAHMDTSRNKVADVEYGYFCYTFNWSSSSSSSYGIDFGIENRWTYSSPWIYQQRSIVAHRRRM